MTRTLLSLAKGGFVALALALFSAPAGAQQTLRCLTDEHAQELEANDPQLARMRAALDEEIYQIAQSNTSARNNHVTRIVPVVVHIVHQYGSENISKAEILTAISKLNTDWARRNRDTASPRRTFLSVGSDLNVEFRLATLDPDGNPTDGITRVSHPYTVLPTTHDSVKSVRFWPGTRYFNIWLVRAIESTGGLTTLGYAQFPYPSGRQTWDTWGVVEITSAAQDAADRTLSHEAGHCFNLYHTFQGGCDTQANCALTGDRVCDTPQALVATYNCSTTQNTCHGDSPDQVDMIENFMSYDNCQNMFSQGQRNRVDAAIAAVPQLRGIMAAANLAAAGVDSIGLAVPFTGRPVADFGTRTTSICQGNPVTLYDASYNGTFGPGWTWTFIVPGSRNHVYTTAVSTVSPGPPNPNVSVIFDTAGSFPITLIVSGPNGSDTVTKVVVNVRPNAGHIAVLPVPAGQVAYEESFEQGFAGDPDPFKNYYVVGGGWNVTTVAAVHGTHSATVPNNGTGLSGKTRTLYTPNFNLSGIPTSTRLYLFFKRALARRTQTVTNDELVVTGTTNCGNGNWAVLLNNIRNMTSTPTLYSTPATFASRTWIPNQADWVLDSMALPASLRGANVQLRFEMTADNAQALYIDDVQIGVHYVANTPVAVATALACANCLSLDVMPHPATSSSQIELTTTQAGAVLYVTDATGRSIAQRVLPASGSQLVLLQDVAPGLAPGVYMLRLQSSEGRLVRRMVVAN